MMFGRSRCVASSQSVDISLSLSQATDEHFVPFVVVFRKVGKLILNKSCTVGA